jgi:hypothetical protein
MIACEASVEPPDEREAADDPQDHDGQVTTFAEWLAKEQHEQRKRPDSEQEEDLLDPIQSATGWCRSGL